MPIRIPLKHMLELKLAEYKTDVRDTLEKAIKECDDLQSVMILGLAKDGRQMLTTSTMSSVEKTFLLAFANAWMAKWFDIK